MAINNYIGTVDRNNAFEMGLRGFAQAAQEAKAQKLKMAQDLITSGAYQPTTQQQPTNMLQNVIQSLTGPKLGGQSMNVLGQNFQMQTPETKMANLKAQLAQIQGMNQGGGQPQGGSPMTADVAGGLPKSLPGYQVSPGDIDMSAGTVSPKVTMTTPMQQAEYEDKLIDIQNKQQAQKDNQETNQYAGMQPEEIQKQIAKNSPTEWAILKKLVSGDMTLKDLPVRNPAMVKRIIGDLAIAYPGFDEQKIAARRKTKLDFAAGGSIGKQATTAGTMIQHMYELRKAIDELGDTGFKPLNQLVQTGKRMFGPGSAPLKKYDVIKNAIAGEWDKYLRAGGSAEAGIDRILNGMDEADTPDAQKAALDEMANLMAGRMGQYVDEWKSSFDQPNDPKIPNYVLSTRTRFALQKMGLDDVIKGVENPEGTAGVDTEKEQGTAQPQQQSQQGWQSSPSGLKYRIVQ
jgi:hypothetical protein